MSKKTLYLLGILLTAIVGAILNWLMCCPSGGEANIKTKSPVVVAPVVTPEVPPSTKNGLVFNDNSGDFNYRTNDNFNFNDSSFSILNPVSNKVDEGIDKLKSFFETNPNKEINLIGHYKGSEENTSAFPNLGIARANSVKNYLVGKGISSKNINLSSKLDDELNLDDGIYYGPINYDIITTESDNTDKLKVLHDEIVADPLIVYFNTGDSSLNLDAAQRVKMQKISNYIDKADDGQVNVVGHTDSVGSVTKNTQLGLERAKTVKGYLIQNGIDAEKIAPSSQGPRKPIASNKTKSGRAKNRRVEVTLK